jgi:hypothetical protein
VALPTGAGLDPRPDPRPHRAPLREAAAGMGGRGSQPRPARPGQLLPLRHLGAEVRPHRLPRQRTPRDPRQGQARTPRPQPGHPLQLRVGDPARHPSPDRNGETDTCVCRPVNDVGEPCAGEPHARFDAAAGGAPAPVGPARAARPWPPPADPTEEQSRHQRKVSARGAGGPGRSWSPAISGRRRRRDGALMGALRRLRGGSRPSG